MLVILHLKNVIVLYVELVLRKSTEIMKSYFGDLFQDYGPLKVSAQL
jgi:hypothetical protein